MKHKYQFTIVSILLAIPIVMTTQVIAKDRAVMDVAGQKTTATVSENIRLDQESKADRVVTSTDLQPTADFAASAANFDIPWKSINSGGGPQASTSYSMNVSIGQSVIGYATSTGYQAGIGYWYGASGCDCPFQADINGDGFIDSVDLGLVIDIVFFGGADIQDSGCSTTRGDFNANGFADSVDLSELIDYVFFGGPSPVDPCATP